MIPGEIILSDMIVFALVSQKAGLMEWIRLYVNIPRNAMEVYGIEERNSGPKTDTDHGSQAF